MLVISIAGGGEALGGCEGRPAAAAGGAACCGITKLGGTQYNIHRLTL